MKTEKQKTGKKGEDIAIQFLKDKQYKILERNWRWRRSEIDIIAMDKEVLVFIEVKTRSYNLYGPPELSVTKRKEQLFSDASSVYMEKINHGWEIRFDIITITLSKTNAHKITHFEDAFFPGLE